MRLKMTLVTGYSPYNSYFKTIRSFLLIREIYFCIVFKQQVFSGTRKFLAALKNERKNVWLIALLAFNMLKISRLSTYWLALKEMFSILAISFLFGYVTLFTSSKQGIRKRGHYLVVSMHWVWLTEINLSFL